VSLSDSLLCEGVRILSIRSQLMFREPLAVT
jgi:hypothetical protein